MFRFKQFTVVQDRSAMKVTTDACLFGAWIAQRLEEKKNKAFHLLDIGAGTGLLSLMIAQEYKNVKIDAIELDEGSLEDLKFNFKESPWSEKLNGIHIDALDFQSKGNYDVIVCNPPFYGKEWTSPDPGRKLAHHGSGLKLEDLPALVKKHLSPEGKFFFLLPYKRLNEINRLLDENALFIHNWLLARQTPSHDPFRVLVEGTMEKPLLSSFDELVIKNEGGQYTDEFRSLIKGYYLYE
jgi:tRNA1Val (adenine37-N6)-methyltransferase